MTAATTQRPTGRLERLLTEIEKHGGRWDTDRAARFYRDRNIAPPGARWQRTRAVARGDLRDLAAWGWLTAHTPTTYSLTTSTTGEPS
jgi:hypothetical protein